MKKYEYVKGQANQSLSIVQAQKESGLSVSEWCSKVGLNRKTFYYHARKVSKLNVAPEGESTEPWKKAREEKEKKKKAKPGKKGNAPTEVKFLELDLTQSSQTRGSDKSGMVPDVVVEFNGFKILVGGNASKTLLADVMEVVTHV